MTIIEREKWICGNCGAEDYYYELKSTNDFWGDPEDPDDYGPPKLCPKCDSDDVNAKGRIFISMRKGRDVDS